MNRARMLISVAAVFLLAPSAKAADPTVFFIVRHAEKEPGNGDVGLTAAGKERAKDLAAMMKTLRVSVIYSTNALRARQTAMPTAEAVQQKLRDYEYNAGWAKKLPVEHKGKNILIVGHSDTIHEIAVQLAGSAQQEAGDVYDQLFIVRIEGDAKSIVRLRYGAAAE
ncbi:MAG TPA: phosphoglycerate mutase family protein [Pirellulales bacterium]|nr:phosphoglycerate mutase family protein [Pirellulales bacterium]